MIEPQRNRYTRRRLVALACQASLGALLCACTVSPTIPSRTASATDPAVGTVTPHPTITRKPTPKFVLEGEIVVGVSTGSYKGWQTLADAYSTLHPKVRVTIDLQLNGASRDQFYREQLAGGAPGLSLANINTLGDLYSAQAFVNWDSYLNSINPYTGETWSEAFLPGCLDFGRSSPREQFMLSTELFQVLSFFNRDLASKLGLNPDQPPQSWDDLSAWVDTASHAGYVGIDLVENGDEIDWLARNYADSWYTTPRYWQLCACQPGDPCYSPGGSTFPSADWRSNIYFDDPDKVDFSGQRAWQALDDGFFLGDNDDAFMPMMEELKKVLNKTSVPADWRTTARSAPLAFYSGQALVVCAGSWFIASCAQAVQKLRAGTFEHTAAGRATATPNPQASEIKSFNLGVFPLPRQSDPVQVQYQRTIELPSGYWGVPRKTQRQNELEVDFVMFITSPAMAAQKVAAELASENAEGNIIGIPAIKGITYLKELQHLFNGLHPQGNNQKPHPLNMVMGGLPSDVKERKRLLADYFDTSIDAEGLRNGLLERRKASRSIEQAEDNNLTGKLTNTIEPNATP